MIKLSLGVRRIAAGGLRLRQDRIDDLGKLLKRGFAEHFLAIDEERWRRLHVQSVESIVAGGDDALGDRLVIGAGLKRRIVEAELPGDALQRFDRLVARPFVLRCEQGVDDTEEFWRVILGDATRE